MRTFEPHPGNFAILQANLNKPQYKNVKTYNLAVSDRNERAVLFLSPGRSSHRFLPGYTETRGRVDVPNSFTNGNI